MDTGCDRLCFAGQNTQQEASKRSLTGLVKIDVRVGVVGNNGIAVLQHTTGEDSMQIERDHDGNAFAQNLTDLSQEPAFRIVLTLGGHGAMQRKIDAIHRWCIAHGL